MVKCDVLIVGGGAAGIAAAIAAARAGAETVLVERNGSLGGMGTAALVHSICGLYRLREAPGAEPGHVGIPVEFAERLIRSGASAGPVRMGRLDVLPYAPPGFAWLADAMTAECANLRVCLHTELLGVEVSGAIHRVRLGCRGRTFECEPSAVVDTSGDAAVAALASLPVDKAPSDQLQRAAFIFSLHGADLAGFDDDGRLRIAHSIADAAAHGVIDRGCLGAQLRASGRGSEVFVTMNLAGAADFDPLDPDQLSGLEREGRWLAVELTQFLRTHHTVFARSHIAAFPVHVGIRETRRWRGCATVTNEDVLLGSDSADCVAMGHWPMELREHATGVRWRFPRENRPTQIPLGALRASEIQRTWMAGRCISCEHGAHAAVRVIGTCMATGQAAGAAAALEANTNAEPSAQAVRNLLQQR